MFCGHGDVILGQVRLWASGVTMPGVPPPSHIQRVQVPEPSSGACKGPDLALPMPTIQAPAPMVSFSSPPSCPPGPKGGSGDFCPSPSAPADQFLPLSSLPPPTASE